MSTKKKVLITGAIILALLVGYSVYSKNRNSVFIATVNNNLESYVKPYIENNSFKIGDERYILQVKSVSISDDIEDYKKNNAVARVKYDIYINDLSPENYFDEARIDLEINKGAEESTDYTFINRNNSKSITNKLLQEFISSYNTAIETTIDENDNYDGTVHTGTTSATYDELAIIDEAYRVEKAGKGSYKAVSYSGVHSRTYKADYYLEDAKKAIEVNIETEGVSEDYNLLWNINVQNVNEVEIIDRSNGDSYNLNNHNIESMLDYLGSIHFEVAERGISIDEELHIVIRTDDLDYDILVSNNAIAHNTSGRIRYGKKYVDKLKEIIAYNVKINPNITNVSAYEVKKPGLEDEISGIHVFTTQEDYKSYVEKYMKVEKAINHYKADFSKENLIIYSSIMGYSDKARSVYSVVIEGSKVKLMLSDELNISFEDDGTDTIYCITSDIIVDKNLINNGVKYEAIDSSK